ncbi:MAG: DNA repair exonuclease [Candidatus Altiarchaeota archaeon]|nr:DNA repair exonuclease [Candidatus Altiarchaeota archaeon]
MASICCISDCHLGFRHRLKKQRLKDYEKAFNEALDKALARDPSLFIFGGDLFHHTRPDPKSMQVAVRRLMEVADSTPCILCIGNHEIETYIGSSYTPILSDIHENIHVLTSESPHLVFDIDGKRVGVHGFQYTRDKRMAEEKLGEISSEVSGNDYDILCIHQAIEHYLEPHEISLAALRGVAEKYDLILSGHFHRHQPIEEVSDTTSAFYIGSTERISFNESMNVNGFLFFENFRFDRPEFIPVESSPMRVVRESAGRKKPSEINKMVEDIIEENRDCKCLRVSLSAEVDGDYFDVFHDWDSRYPDYTILDVSIMPTASNELLSLKILDLNEDSIFDEYFEKMGLSNREELKELCKEMYKKHGNNFIS